MTQPDYIKLWFDNLISEPSWLIEGPIEATGICNVHMGGRLMFASVRVCVEPAPHFEVIDQGCKSKELEQNLQLIAYPNCVVYGMLDIFLLSRFPLRDVRLVIKSLDYHPIDSSFVAFREAGRDAAKKIIENMLNRI